MIERQNIEIIKFGSSFLLGSTLGSSMILGGFLGYFWVFLGLSRKHEKTLWTLIHKAFKRLGEKIRTSGLLNPIQARYQTAPHPDIIR